MVPVYGRIKDSVNQTVMQNQWQQKKKDINEGKKAFQNGEDRQLQLLQQQVDQIRENKPQSEIDAKLAAGSKLSPEEIEYLRKNAPQKLKEYEDMKRERKAYENELKNCKTKEEVEDVKMTKMGQYMATCKEISTNPNIPKGQKVALLQKLVRQVAGIEAEHLEFEESAQYAQLPEDEEERKERDQKTPQESDGSDGTENGAQADLTNPQITQDVIQTLGEEIRKHAGQEDTEAAAGIVVDAKVGADTGSFAPEVKEQDFQVTV